MITVIIYVFLLFICCQLTVLHFFKYKKQQNRNLNLCKSNLRYLCLSCEDKKSDLRRYLCALSTFSVRGQERLFNFTLYYDFE